MRAHHYPYGPMRGREGGQRLGSRGCDCWHPENWCPATRRGDRPGTLPALSVLCSVCSAHFFCSQLLLLIWMYHFPTYPYHYPFKMSYHTSRCPCPLVTQLVDRGPSWQEFGSSYKSLVGAGGFARWHSENSIISLSKLSVWNILEWLEKTRNI